ncbi:DUF6048 family protein [Robiginitalea sp. M366]|uniref:DUF6048 family protein n=1 Tax=Robiginitalea aestuariiviva TaxID=3036903 RepID=UPI00240D837C|nr:DUF6048 family protein [Robiginitalea aestuariiviva]MDG1573166.1 DUF6048 family protein [Robiginitalea aestuariiviva]
MSRFFINLIWIGALLPLGLFGQESSGADSLGRSQKYGLRVGVDLSRPVRGLLDDTYQGLELTGDFRLSYKWYLAAELGNESWEVSELLDNTDQVNIQNLYTFTSSGSYLKAGFDYNTYENWYGMNNSIFAGARVGFSSFSTDLDSYSLYNSNRYWNPEGFPAGSGAPQNLSGLNAAWVEMLLGVKAELFANLYLGASVRIGMLVSRKESDVMPHIWIPGFNRVTEGSSFGAGFNYTLSYLIPLYRKSKNRDPEAGEPP